MERRDGQAGDATGTDRYLVAGCTPWARRVFDEQLSKLPGKWLYASTPDELVAAVQVTGPRLAFFLHWRWRVPAVVLEATQCVGFHLGSFSHYRGGTPLQYQIENGDQYGSMTIYRMTEELDAGPVYTTWPVALHGSAEAVYARAMDAAAIWITAALHDEQRGLDPWDLRIQLPGELGPVFRRRTPAQSELLPDLRPLEQVYDHIRMLDAAGYPHAFLDHGRLRLTFRRAVLYDGRVECDCTITLRDESK